MHVSCDPQLSTDLQNVFTLHGSFKKHITQTDCKHKSRIVCMTVQTFVEASYFLHDCRKSLRFIEVGCHTWQQFLFQFFLDGVYERMRSMSTDLVEECSRL